MRKIKGLLLKAGMVLCAFLLFSLNAAASQGTTYTYTISVDGDYIRTQEAYIASAVYLRDAGLRQPNDIFVFGRSLYIADTGNRRVLVYDMDTQTYGEIASEQFVSPMGLFVNADAIYVADSGAEAVFVLDHQGNIGQTIRRPENSPLMNESSIFKPKNVVVASDGNMYVVGEGSYDGLMQFSASGEFQGYFAANKSNMSLLERIQELIFTDEQKEQLLTRKPRAIQNIDISSRNLVYSVTQSAEVSYAWTDAEEKTSNALKLHNMAGTDILSPNEFMNDEWNFTDVAAGPYGNVYALTYTGLIYEYSSDGDLIFSFGGRAVTGDRYGLFTYAAALDLDDDGFLYVLDKERGLVQVFTQTEFAASTHRAVYELENGDYAQSEQNWNELLQLNGMSRIAHIGYGKSLMRQQKYDEALEHFRIAEDRDYYSECFWEIRNQVINSSIGWVVLGCFLLFLALLLMRLLGKRRKKRMYSAYELSILPGKGATRFFADLRYSFTMLRHPLDAIYYLKSRQRGSLYSAFFLLAVAFLVYMADILGRGFIFNQNSLSALSPLLLTILFFVSFFLFAAANYMVSTINDGEGTLTNLLIVLSYSLVPYVILTPVSILLSYVLTQNEAFVVTLVWVLGIVWSAVLVFLAVMHIHNFSTKYTIKNILLTFFFVIVALVAVAILYLIWDKAIEFVNEVSAEVIYRAEG